ncbi:MAG TPA: metallophosphoesterase family protein [Verrucomicrobiae bacterium]|jgi:diadenosine tetraphosphatase ApaH/serine/threonine PP2A family protein phosphatase|nr:metallophosphoesterase family protein [Verrucomicrobiae bacterium]
MSASTGSERGERFAILSDIHSNLESLQCALERIEPDEKILCLGDIVGYGPNPNECVRIVRERAVAAVLGNHDLAAVDNFGVEHFNPAARAAIEWTQGVIEDENRAWLNTLSYELRFPGYLLVHGAPKNYFEYILDKRAAARAFEATDSPLIFVGHTHVAEYYCLEPDGSISHKHMQHGGELILEEGKRYIVDVGSVGQPRDLNPQASFVRYEADARRVQWVRYDYPIAQVQEKIHAEHLPEYLAARLEAGR